MLRFRSEDFDLVAIFEEGPKWHDAAIDLRADRLVAPSSAHSKCDISRCRALWQLDQFALRREGEDAILVHRHPRMFEQFFRAVGMVEDLDEVVDPGDMEVGDRLAFLVRPVGGKAALGLCMHRPVANLDFDPHLRIMDYGGVQASIAVAFGGRDEVLEAAGDHRPSLMDEAERAVALVDTGDDDPEGHDVG